MLTFKRSCLKNVTQPQVRCFALADKMRAFKRARSLEWYQTHYERKIPTNMFLRYIALHVFKRKDFSSIYESEDPRELPPFRIYQPTAYPISFLNFANGRLLLYENKLAIA